MYKEMSDEELKNCHSYDIIQIHKIREDLENKGITDISQRLDYVKKNYYGQLYMAYAVEELNNVILSNYQKVGDNFQISTDNVDGILRTLGFAIEYMQSNLPQHSYNYMISKSGTFFDELVKHYKSRDII